jgi:hypothetical protein
MEAPIPYSIYVEFLFKRTVGEMTVATKTKSLEELCSFLDKTGLLFEINRTVLHPKGLALAVIQDEETETYQGLTMLETDDPAGYYFGKDSFELGSQKLRKNADVGAWGQKQMNRLEKYGFIVQKEPVEEKNS